MTQLMILVLKLCDLDLLSFLILPAGNMPLDSECISALILVSSK